MLKRLPSNLYEKEVKLIHLLFSSFLYVSLKVENCLGISKNKKSELNRSERMLCWMPGIHKWKLAVFIQITKRNLYCIWPENIFTHHCTLTQKDSQTIRISFKTFLNP